MFIRYKLTTTIILIHIRLDFSVILARNRIIPLMQIIESNEGCDSEHCTISLIIHSNVIIADENTIIIVPKMHNHIYKKIKFIYS